MHVCMHAFIETKKQSIHIAHASFLGRLRRELKDHLVANVQCEVRCIL